MRNASIHPRAVGMDVCIYDPDLDPDGRFGADLATALRAVFLELRGHR